MWWNYWICEPLVFLSSLSYWRIHTSTADLGIGNMASSVLHNSIPLSFPLHVFHINHHVVDPIPHQPPDIHIKSFSTKEKKGKNPSTKQRAAEIPEQLDFRGEVKRYQKKHLVRTVVCLT